MKAIKLLSLSIVSLNTFSLGLCNSLTGQLDKFGILGLLPASFINVTLSNKTRGNLQTVFTGSEGKYFFDDINPGPYVLKIWVKGFDFDPLERDVEVYDDRETTEAANILIYDFTIEYPKEKDLPPTTFFPIRGKEEYLFTAHGSHYALPDDAIIWPVLKCKNGNFLLSTEKPVMVGKKDGKWKSREILVDRSVEAIIAVLVTKGGNNQLRLLVSIYNRLELNSLPDKSCILAENKIGIN